MYEQLAIYLFNPSLNISFNIYPISQHKTYDFTKALKLVNELISVFTEGHYMYLRFIDMRSDIIKAKYVLDLTNESGASTLSTKGGKPIIVYEFSQGNIINYFSSINIAMKVLGVKYQTLISAIQDKILIKDNLAIAYGPLSLAEIKTYVLRLTFPTKLRVKGFKIRVIDFQSGEVVYQYKSIREAARQLKPDQGSIRKAIENKSRFRSK